MQLLIGIGLVLLFSMQGGCALQSMASKPVLDESGTKQVVAVDPAETWPKEALTNEVLYNILLAEIAGKRGYIQLSSSHYVQAALASQDPRVAARAMRITLYTRENEASVKLARHWIALQPDNLEVRRSLIYLSMRMGQGDDVLENLVYLLEATDDRNEVYHGLQEVMTESDPLLAMEVMENLLTLYPQDAWAHLLYGRLSLQSNLYDLAMTHAQQALVLQPELEAAVMLLVQTQIAAGEKSQAFDTLIRALQDLPDSLVLHRLYGKLLMLDKQQAAAVKQFQWVLSRDQADVDALMALGLVALENKQSDLAINYFEKIIALDNGAKFDAYYYMGLVARERGQLDQLEQWFAKVTQGKFLIKAGIERAHLMQQRGELQKARTLLHGLSQKQPQAVQQLLLIESRLLIGSGLHQEAMDLLNKGLTKWKDAPILLYGRMEVAVELGYIEQAEKDLKKLIQQRPDDANALNTLGYLLLEQTDRYQEALAYIERAFVLAPGSQAIIDSMGWAYYRLGQNQKALEYLQKAHAMGDEAEIASHLGEVLWIMNRKQEALQIWQQSLQKYPDSDYLQEVMQRFLP